MNAPSKIEQGNSVLFRLNRSQAMRIPKDLAFPDDVREVIVRRSGESLIITPVAKKWSDFFAMLPIDDDFAVPADPPPLDVIDPL
jgi:antitoxin VapB